MTDEALIAAVAKRLGWTFVSLGRQDQIDQYIWKNQKGDDESLPPWLTSVDAALGVLDKDCRVSVLYSPWNKQWTVGYIAVPLSAEDKMSMGVDESFPRAILLAFLESQEEKP